jgi:hypothetical protein
MQCAFRQVVQHKHRIVSQYSPINIVLVVECYILYYIR